MLWIKFLTRAIAVKLSNSEDEILFKLLLPGESGDEKTELEDVDKEVESEVERLGTDTLLGLEDIAIDEDPADEQVPAATTSAPDEVTRLSVQRLPTPLQFVPSQAKI